MNEQQSKNYRTLNEHLSNRNHIFINHITKIQNFYEIRKENKRCFICLRAFASRCVELRRNDITKRKRGGDGGDDPIGGKEKIKNKNAILYLYFLIFFYTI